MSAHLSDRRLLAELIRLAEIVLSRPLGMFPSAAFDGLTLAGDLVAAMRCPTDASPIGAAEAILFTALQKITSGGRITGGDVVRYAFIAQQALAMVRENYFAMVRADAFARARGEVHA